jgi:hypothetical protein
LIVTYERLEKDEYGPPVVVRDAPCSSLAEAIGRDHPLCLCEFCPEHYHNAQERLFEMCVRKASMACLKHLHGKGYKFYNYTYGAAASHGHLEVMEWAHSQGFHMTDLERKEVCWRAVASNSPHILEWIRERGLPWAALTRE